MEIETETLSEERVQELIELKDSLVTNYLMINSSPLSGYHILSNFQYTTVIPPCMALAYKVNCPTQI